MESAAPLLTAVVALGLCLGAVLDPQRKRARSRLEWDLAALAGACAVIYLAIFLDSRIHWRLFDVGTALGVILAGPTFVSFMGNLLRRYRAPNPEALRNLWIVAAVLMLVETASLAFSESVALLLYRLSDLFLFGCLMYALTIMLQVRRTTHARLDLGRLNALLAFSAFVAVLLATEGVLRGLIGAGMIMSIVPPVGTLSVAVYLYFLRDSLVRGRLLDAREIVGKGAVFGLMSLLLAVLFPLIIYGVGRADNRASLLVNTFLAAVVVVILHEPLRLFLTRLVQPTVIRRTSDLDNALRALYRRLPTLMDPTAVAEAAVGALRSSGHINQATMYLWNDRAAGYTPAAMMNPTGRGELPDRVAPIAAFDALDAESGPIGLEALERMDAMALADTEDTGHHRALAALLRSLHADLLLPLTAGVHVAGWVGLRREEEGPPWDYVELKNLHNYADRVSAALDNSRAVEGLKERERLAGLGRMSAGLAHEIRNPLGAIKGAAQLLQGTELADTEDMETLAIIIEETDRLSDIVGQFLDYARPLSRNSSSVDLDKWTRQVGKLIRAAGLPEAVMFEEQSPPPGTMVILDAEKLRQVALNLVRNACEAVGEDGHVTLGARRCRRGDAELSGAPTGWRSQRGRLPRTSAAWVEFWVEDDGPGISAEHRESLFVPFFTTKDKGTGLGLPACVRLVRALGGEIEVATATGDGTRFTVRVPDEAETPEAETVEDG